MSNSNSELEQGFENPPELENSGMSEDEYEESADYLEEPENLGDFESASTEAEESEYMEFDETLLQIKADVETQLSQAVAQTSDAVQAENVFEGAGNIQGIGLGISEDPSQSLAPGAASLNLYVAEPVSVDEAKAALVDSMGISAASSDDIPVNVIVTGIIDAQPHRFKIRPAPGGVSVGHTRVTAGTLGCLARGRRAPRNGRLLMLSNNHVIANSNNASFRDPIIQPGRLDGGRSPRDQIAILERFVPINFRGGRNYVDAATGWCWPSRVRKELVYVSGGSPRYFRVSSRIVACRRGMIVGKSGRTTQLTRGQVTDCNATIRVNYGGGRVALFADQITIRGTSGNFSAGGDSGSLIWTYDSRRNPVGLLFAGGGGLTFANKITRVMAALDINLYT
ncbi:MAG: hypothetical protein F6K50_28115 [Moorea sp. SIO3I7]|uniref:hypothetical protein n=1 Tax=unclassified Moorena TaxID=2683338 RepID=UPI0013C0537B|nr:MULTISPECIES: hypothetical protein [unclassified Moorena]NEN99206.1 hypothetical protein [Moorena sp. SIO3I7]NEO08801.1 hypothetical protein [Moorena sp. SIO3I8]NEP22930.1 hypothetical protein [Moorena sp. SIO3I6]